MPKLRDILKDAAKYPDTLVVTLAGGEQIQLGELRSFDAENRAALVKEQERIAGDRRALESGLSDLRVAQQRTAELFASLQAGGGASTTTVDGAAASGAAPTDLFASLTAYENDQVFGPIVKALRAQHTVVTKLKEEALGELLKNQREMASAYVRDRIEDQLERIPNRDAKVTDQQIIEYALRNNLKTSTGVPNVRKAYAELTAVSTEQAKIDAAVKAALDKAAAEHKTALDAARGSELSSPSRPSGLSLVARPPEGTGPNKFKSLDEALEAAARDTSIWGGLGAQA